MKKITLIITALAFTVIARAGNFTETFTSDPLTKGWQIFGDTNLFHWDSTNHNEAVTWDSSQPNSYFYRPLGVTLTTNSDFAFSFDITLKDADIEGGTFQVSIGLVNLADATNADFLRDTGFNSTNVVEFDYFMDPVYGNSPTATENDEKGYFADVYDNLSFDTNTTYHVTVVHFAGDSLVSSEVTVSNQVFSFMLGGYLETGFGNFNLNTLAIMSYSDTGAYGASLLAHGSIANFSFTTSPNPIGNFNGQLINSVWQGQFQSYSNWNYIVERSADLKTWQPASATNSGNGTILTIPDTNTPPDKAFYRVHARR